MCMQVYSTFPLLVIMGCACDKDKVELEGRTFAVRRTIGAGGFSVVYLVEERRRQFAMKKIVCHSRRELKRAVGEIKLHRQLADVKEVLQLEASSDVDQIEQEVMTEPGELHFAVEVYLVLPYFRRGTLQDDLIRRCAERKHFEERKVLEIFADVCEAVRHLHSLQPIPYAHRDLKPGNVLLHSDDRGVLMDLGSAEPARVTVNNSKEAQILQDYAAEHCSMAYRAPELFHVETHSTIDEKSDIWSLGCLLFAICFFASPFDKVHERGDSVALAVMAGNIQIPNDSPYSVDIHQMILQSLQTIPATRPSAEELLSLSHRALAKVTTDHV